jgi:hypothetical protein
MHYTWRLLLLTAFFGVVSTAADLRLEELIPKEKWEETGIAKLNQQEQKRLVSEIAKLAPVKPSSGGVAVIAPSISTGVMAREVLAKLRASEVGFCHADVVLVVVRSSLYNPLLPSYASVCDLQKDADGQRNIAGPNFHVYLYAMDDNLRVTQTGHQSLPADR